MFFALVRFCLCLEGHPKFRLKDLSPDFWLNDKCWKMATKAPDQRPSGARSCEFFGCKFLLDIDFRRKKLNVSPLTRFCDNV